VYRVPVLGGSGSLAIDSSASDLLANVGSVSKDVSNSVMSWVYMFVGIPLGFYIMYKLLTMTGESDTKEKKVKPNIVKGYHRIVDKDGKDMGWEKDF